MLIKHGPEMKPTTNLAAERVERIGLVLVGIGLATDLAQVAQHVACRYEHGWSRLPQRFGKSVHKFGYQPNTRSCEQSAFERNENTF